MDIIKHQESFDTIYKKLPINYGIEFPLLEINKIEWNRGEYSNQYYNYFYKRFSVHILGIATFIRTVS